MPKGTSLTDFEKGEIMAHYDHGLSSRQIAIFVKRSKTVINNFLKDPEGYGSKKRTGRKRKLKKRTMNSVVNKLKNTQNTLTNTIKELDLNCTVATLSKSIKRDGRIKNKIVEKSFSLSDDQKKARLTWAKNQLLSDIDFRSVLWTDEKRFCKDGPDGFKRFCFENGKKEPKKCFNQNGGGSIMVWGGFNFYGKTDLIIMEGKVNAAQYTDVIREQLPKFGRKVGRNNVIFQQDNAPIHKAHITMDYLENSGFQCVDWPARSPDLNPIENIWGILSSRVYGNGKVYKTLNELKKAVVEEWNKLTIDECRNLITSMRKRCVSIVEKGGEGIDY